MPWGQAEAVFRQTEGNPLFVQEVLHISGQSISMKRLSVSGFPEIGWNSQRPRRRFVQSALTIIAGAGLRADDIRACIEACRRCTESCRSMS